MAREAYADKFNDFNTDEILGNHRFLSVGGEPEARIEIGGDRLGWLLLVDIGVAPE